jgi:hypothetical protein
MGIDIDDSWRRREPTEHPSVTGDLPKSITDICAEQILYSQVSAERTMMTEILWILPIIPIAVVVVWMIWHIY